MRRPLGMELVLREPVDREHISRGLIELVASAAWAERLHLAPSELLRARDEAISLLPNVQQGDHAAARRALELLNRAHGRAQGREGADRQLEREAAPRIYRGRRVSTHTRRRAR